MSAGMMPTLAPPTETRPGQFGPTSATPRRSNVATTAIMSWTGMPSVTQTTTLTPASAASVSAARAAPAGTNCTATLAPVAATAAATSANTGTPATVWPAFLGEVPATTAVPAASMRCV